MNAKEVRAVVGEVLRTPPPWVLGVGAWLTFMAVDEVLLADAAAVVTPGAVLLFALCNPKVRRGALRARTEREAERLLGPLRDDVSRLDASTRARLDAILRAYVAVCREGGADDVPRYAQAPLTATQTQMRRLVEQAAELAAHRAQLGAYVGSVSFPTLRGQQALLRVRHDRASDPVLRTQLEQSLRFKNEEADAYEAITVALGRVDGQLESIECAFAALQARLLRFKSDERTEWKQADQALHEEMSRLSAQVDALDQSVREVLLLRVGA